MNRSSVIIAAGIASLFHLSTALCAGADHMAYGPPDSWVLPPPAAPVSALSTNAAVRFVYLDTQVRITPDGTEQDYNAYRLKIMKPEGLAAGNLSLSWQPDTGGMTVHYLRLVRDGQTSDVLASTKFVILQREAQLERSVLTGLRTATLQVPGLEVGDELELAVTIDKRDAGLDGRAAGFMLFPLAGVPGTFRFRLLWPSGRPLQWRATKDLSAIEPTTADGQTVLDVTLRNPSGVTPTEGAPARYNIRRLIEYRISRRGRTSHVNWRRCSTVPLRWARTPL